MTSYFACVSLVFVLAASNPSLCGTRASNLTAPMVLNMAFFPPTSETTTNIIPSKPFVRKRNIIDQGTVSKHQYETFKFVFDFILKPIVCVVGIVLNVIGIFVLLQPQLRHGFYIYLTTLAIADTSYLLCGLNRFLFKVKGKTDVETISSIHDTVFPYIHQGFEIPCCKIGAYCIILFSLDRLLAVIYPLKVKDMFLSRHSKIICPILVAFVFMFYFPTVLNYELTEVTSGGNGTRTRLTQMKHEEGSTMAEVISVYTMTKDVIFTYLPPVLICIINICILVMIYRARSARKRLFANPGKRHPGQHKLIVTVFIISTFFLAVYIPMIISRYLKYINPEYNLRKREHYAIMMIPSLVSLGWSVNAAIDFTVYLATSDIFRTTLQAACCKKFRRAKSQKSRSQTMFSRTWGTITTKYENEASSNENSSSDPSEIHAKDVYII